MITKKSLAIIMTAVTVGLLSMLGFGLVAAQQDPAASRSLPPAAVAPGGEVVVAIAASGYGQAGGVTETLPAGFAYLSSSLDTGQVHVTGQQVRFTLQGDTSFTYTVTASSMPGSYQFSGTLRDFDRMDHEVGGNSSVTVEEAVSQQTPTPAPTQPAPGTPSASRSFDKPSVAQGGDVVVTIDVANYGQAGGVTETLPTGFTYVSSSLDAEQVTVTGQEVRFTLQADTSFTYTVTASRTVGSHTFSGMLRDFDRMDHAVGGASSVTVGPSDGSTARASRSFDKPSVAQGGVVVVTVDVANYGQAGGVTETLPAGFAYVSSSLDTGQVHVTGQEVRFTLQADTSFTYTVTASRTVGSHTFSGMLRDFDRMDHAVGGASSVTVGPSDGSTARASRSFDKPSVAQGGVVVVTVDVANYGQAGGVTETLPAGFTYVSSSLSDDQVLATGQQVRFTLQGDTSFTYTVTASMTAGSYEFEGTLRDFDRNDTQVVGDDTVTVGPYAARSFSRASVDRGQRVMVTINVANYGQAGGVTETLPAGFTYVSSSLDTGQVHVTGQQVRFTLQGDTSFTYTVTASRTVGSHTFSGMLRDFDRMDHAVGGDTSVTVATPRPTATRRPSGGGGSSSGSDGGGGGGQSVDPTSTPTPRPTSTHTPVPTATPAPTATSAPTPTPPPTPRPAPTATSAPSPTATTAPTATATSAPAPTVTTAPTATPTTAPAPTATTAPAATSIPAPTATTAPTATPTTAPAPTATATPEEEGGAPVLPILLIIAALVALVGGGLFFFRSRTR